jgi:hypothetical protein
MTSLPVFSLPTDNLYKFRAIAYLTASVFFIFSAFYLLITFAVTRQNNLSLKATSAEQHKLDSVLIVDKKAILRDQMSMVSKHLNVDADISASNSRSMGDVVQKLKKVELSTYYELVIQLQSATNNWKEFEEYRKLNQEYLDLLQEQTKRETMYNIKMTAIESENVLNTWRPIGCFFAVLLFIFSIVLTKKNFKDWDTKYQRFQDLILQRKSAEV